MVGDENPPFVIFSGILWDFETLGKVERFQCLARTSVSQERPVVAIPFRSMEVNP
jgi:hypothetical protein